MDQKTLLKSTETAIFSSLRIGNLLLDTPVVLAPMAGVTDRSFRRICRRSGAGMVFTELVAAEAIVRRQEKTWNLARFHPAERPLGIQLFSHEPQTLAEAAACLEALQPDVIDLNFGCPVKKVVRRGAGAGFLEDLDRLSAAVRAVVKRTSLPVTVKLRSGPSADRINAVEAAQRSADEGASAVIIHARTTRQLFHGKADWSVISRVKEAVQIPIIGNGDVTTPEDALRMMKETGCDSVMIGRATYGNPWIFSACRAILKGQPYRFPLPAERWSVIEDHYRLMIADKGARIGVREMRKHLGWYSKGLPNAAQYRARVFKLDDPDAVIAASRSFFLNAAETARAINV